MSRRRRSYETGHKPKLLVVIDDTEECDRAVYFASRRAARIGGNVIMLRAIEMHDRASNGSVSPTSCARRRTKKPMRSSANTPRGPMALPASRLNAWCAKATRRKKFSSLIDEDEDIFILVLAAGTGAEGPGPLVASIGRTAGDYPIPVAIVPGHLTDEELDALS